MDHTPAPIRADRRRGHRSRSGKPIKRLAVLLIAMLLPIAGVLVEAVPAPAQAATHYFFKPGHPTYFGGPRSSSYCTGGYAIRGTSGLFFLTDGHCAAVGSAVYGTAARFGRVAYSRWAIYDTALIRPDSGVDALQIVVDPVTRRSPGKVVGIFSASSLGTGVLVGKMGVRTGWSEGRVYGTIRWYNMTAYCSHARTGAGDSGGPVWRSDGAGHVWAVGITVAYAPSTGDGCFIPIQTLLSNWGAWLPVFPHRGAPMAVPKATRPLPILSTKGLRPAVGRA